MPSREEVVDEYHQQGFAVVDDAVDPAMMDELEAAARRAQDKVRSGEVDVHSIKDEDGEPHVLWGLIAPEFGEPVFANYLISAPVEAYSQAFLGPELQLGWVCLFCTGNGAPYDSTWHRDLNRKDIGATEEEEMALLTAPATNLKWHLALVDDPCFRIVPGSHRRYRTEEEADVLANRRKDDLSQELTVELKRGQTVFWTGRSIHRGVAPEGTWERLALHGGIAEYREDAPLQEEVDGSFLWRLSPHIRENLPDRMKLYYDRWRALQPDPK